MERTFKFFNGCFIIYGENLQIYGRVFHIYEKNLQILDRAFKFMDGCFKCADRAFIIHGTSIYVLDLKKINYNIIWLCISAYFLITTYFYLFLYIWPTHFTYFDIFKQFYVYLEVLKEQKIFIFEIPKYYIYFFRKYQINTKIYTSSFTWSHIFWIFTHLFSLPFLENYHVFFTALVRHTLYKFIIFIS